MQNYIKTFGARTKFKISNRQSIFIYMGIKARLQPKTNLNIAVVIFLPHRKENSAQEFNCCSLCCRYTHSMSRTIAALTLMLGLVAVSAATYSTATPVRFIPKTESCPVDCICVKPTNEDDLSMEVVCPTEETANIINGGSSPMDVNVDDAVDVGAFIAAHPKVDSSEENFSLKEDVIEPSATPEASAIPVASPSPSPSPSAEQPTELPLVFPIDKTETSEEVVPRKIGIIDEENFTLHPDEVMLGDEAVDEDYSESTGPPPPIEVAPSDFEETKDEEPKPSPTATPASDEEKKMIVSAEEKSEEKKSIEEEVVVPSAAAEMTATLKPLVLAVAASTPEPEKFSLSPDVDETESKEPEELEENHATPTAAPTDIPLVFNDPIPASSATPELEKKIVVEFVESIDDVLKPDEFNESSSTLMPLVALKELVDVDTNQLDESLTSEDLVLAASDPEMSGKMLSEDEAPGVTQAPEQSTASWVILGLILAMFVGVLLYAAIKGRLDTGGQDMMPKLSSISSTVATTGEFTKNRRPSNEGTEMKEMSKALLGSPLEDRVSRFIDEEDEEQIKRLLQQEADEILEQVIVEMGDAQPVNNALEKPPRKFINVPPPVVPGRDGSIPNTPTLVRAKVVDMSPEVHHIGNGNATTTSLQ